MKSLIFDVDGTILDSMPMWLDLENKLLSKYGYTMDTIDRQMRDTIESLSIMEMSEYIAENIAIDLTSKDVYHYFQSSIDFKYANEVKPKGGAIKIIKDLYNKGYNMAVASSSSSECIMSAFKRLGIYECFSIYATADNTGFRKSTDEFWIDLVNRISGDFKEVILYDDALYAIEQAKNLGIEVVGIKDFPWNETDWERIVEVSDYTSDNISDISFEA